MTRVTTVASTEQTPEQRAEAAAEELAAEGAAVTVTAVRERAHVGMNVAAAAVRAWKARQVQAGAVPAIPDHVRVRLEGVWPEAVQAARVEHQAERDGWAANLKAVEDERDWALDVATRIQNDLDLMTIRNAELQTAVKQALDAAAQARDLMSGAEARVAEAEARAITAQAATDIAEGVASALREALVLVSHKEQDGGPDASEAGVSATIHDEGGVAGRHAEVFTDSSPATSEWPRS